MHLGFRNAWTYSFLILFSAFTLGILLLHASVASIEGYSDITGTMINMTLYLLPLMTLLLGSFSTTSEKEDGQWALLSTYPISTYTFLFGKWLGLAIILIAIIFFSFGISGLLIILFGQTLDVKTYSFLTLFATILSLTYLSISIFIGAITKNRWQALIVGITIWFMTVVAWPLLMISTLSHLPSYNLIQPVLQLLTILNPAELIRIFTMIQLGAGSAFGADYDQWITWASGNIGIVIFILMISLWIIVAILLSGFIWNRGDQYDAS